MMRARRTKIIATVGPASSADAVVAGLIAAGVDIFRLNFSHGTPETHAAAVGSIRRLSADAGRVVSILQDLGGPKIRTGRLMDGKPLTLADGDELRIRTGDFVGHDHLVFTTYTELARRARPGDRLLLDDGRIELQVVETDGTEVRTRVVDGGSLGEHKGINAPGVSLSAPALTDKDLDDLKFGVSIGIDIAAISFVQNAADLRQGREAAAAAGAPDLPLMAKLERPEAVRHLEDILRACDAVMVARGDLGLEMPLERVPRVQKEITRRARTLGVPIVVATQVLESMRTEPRPTRAEVSDAANAVDDGVDAIMLAGETAVGTYPIRAVEVLDAVIRDNEAIAPYSPPSTGAIRQQLGGGHVQALCEAAVTLARSREAAAIVAITRGGTTARLLSALRPSVSILAVTDGEAMARRLVPLWGVTPIPVDLRGDVDASGAAVCRELLARGVVQAGTVVALVRVSDNIGQSDANFLKLQRL
ncbi:MAG: pyruvate kinase [Acidobacteria bacterium]|nr:pyruvate kinase [Acidobacteriota bacterium]